MYGRHRNGLGIDPKTGTGTVIGSDGRQYGIRMGTNLEGARLAGVDLRGANLESSLLSGVDLRGANLSGANLRSTRLWDANLMGANLEGANLSFAYLNDADLTDANIEGTNFRYARVMPHHAKMIEYAAKIMLVTLEIIPPGGVITG